jgi:hypothetical protein
MLMKLCRVWRILLESLIISPGSEAKHASFSYNVIRKLMLPLLNSFTCDLSTSSGVRNFDIGIPSLVFLVNVIRIRIAATSALDAS